jgi:minor extracellular serine protease Vpr
MLEDWIESKCAMRRPLIVASFLIAASIPTLISAKSFGTFLGTFEIGRSRIEITKENMRKAFQKALREGNRKMVRLAAVVDPTFDESSLASSGWRLLSRTGDVVTLEGIETTVPYLSAIDGILSFQRHSRIFPCMDSARRETHVDEVQGWNPAVHSPLSKQFTGKGIVFGIIETEFDTHHPAFLDSLGHTRFYEIWDATDTSMPSNVGAAYGGYGKIKKGPAIDADSLFATNGFYHGTLITSLGAGSDRAQPWWGVAPEAVIVGVKYGRSDADIINGLKWIFAIADSLKLPCVINMSIGTQAGPHDGTSAFDLAIDTLSKAGHIVIGAAGNDAEQKPHISFPLKTGESRGTFITASASGDASQPLNVESFIDMWGSPNKLFTDTIYVCDVTTLQYKKTSTIVPNQPPDTLYWPNAVAGKPDTLVFQVELERNRFNLKPHEEVLVYGNNPNLMIGVRVASAQAETVHVWNVNKLPFASLGITGFFAGDSLYTVNEIGGTAKRIVTAGGYNSKVALTTWNSVSVGAGDTSLYHYLSYTSLGPTVDGRIKPDISAPAREVVGAMSRIGTDAGRTVYWPNPAVPFDRYEFTGGTSVASPIVAGIIALMLQVNPTLTPETAKQILQQTAINDAYTAQGGNLRWGAGKVDALKAIEQLGVPTVTRPPAQRSAESHGAFCIVASGKNRLSLKGPAGSMSQEALVELFDLSGTLLLRAHVKTGGSVVVPPASASSCLVARVSWRGGASSERILTGSRK